MRGIIRLLLISFRISTFLSEMLIQIMYMYCKHRLKTETNVALRKPNRYCYLHRTTVPLATTSSTEEPLLLAMKPRTVKMTKPAKKLVPQLIIGTTKESLKKREVDVFLKDYKYYKYGQ